MKNNRKRESDSRHPTSTVIRRAVSFAVEPLEGRTFFSGAVPSATPLNSPPAATPATVVSADTTSLSTPSVAGTAYTANTVYVTTQLADVTTGTLVGAALLKFTVTDPSAQTSTYTTATDNTGTAGFSFTPTLNGVYIIVASFDGTASLAAVTSSVGQVPVYQRTQSTLSIPTGSVASASSGPQVAAYLTALPQGTVVPYQNVPVIFESNALPWMSGGVPADSIVGNTAYLQIRSGFAGTFDLTAYVPPAVTSQLFLATPSGVLGASLFSASGTMTIAAVPTSLSAVTVSPQAAPGDPVTFSTVLTANDAASDPVQGRTVVFTITGSDGQQSTESGATGQDGSVSVQYTPPDSSAYSVAASFNPNPNPNAALLDMYAASSSPTLTVYRPTRLVLNPVRSITAGTPRSVSAELTSLSNAVVSQPVVFTLTREADGTQTTLTGNSDSTGSASVTFPSSSLLENGAYDVVAAYAGNTSLSPVASNKVTFGTYAESQLTMAPNVAAVAGFPVTLSATLASVPGTPPVGSLDDLPITFTFSDASGTIGTETEMTDPAGVATVTTTFPTAEVVNVGASFVDPLAYLTDSSGTLPAIPTTTSGTVTVAQPQLTSTVFVNWADGSTSPFTGAAHSAVAGWSSGDGASGPLAVTYYSATDLNTPLTGAPTSVGSYIAAASFAGDATHLPNSGSTSFTITPATPVVGVIDAGGTFNGRSFPATATVANVNGVAAGSLESVTPTIAFYPGTETTDAQLAGLTSSTTPPSVAGNYTVVATFAGSTDYSAADALAPFTIARSKPILTVTDAGGTYNAQAFAATATVAGIVPNVDSAAGSILEGTILTLTYVNTDTLAVLTAAPTQAGHYQATASFAGSTDYLSGSVSTKFTVNKAPLSATGNSYSLVYGQAVPALGGVVTGGLAADGITFTYATSYTPTSSVGSYSVVPTSHDPNNKLSNYAFTSTAGTINVGVAGTSVALSSSTAGVSYYGQSVKLTAALSTQAPGSGTPVGSVQFFSNGASLGAAVPLVNGVASLTTAGLGIGSDGVTAVYTPAAGADSHVDFAASSSATTQTVNVGILLLDSSGKGALTVSGGAQVNAAGGSIVVDSNNASAVVVSGSGSVQATLVSVVGNDSISGAGKVANALTGQKAASDPLATLATPTTSGLTVRSTSTMNIGGSTVVTLQPGVYVGGLTIGGAAKVTLAPGEYYLQGGGLNVGGSATLTGKGVFIYNAPTKAADQVNFSGAASVTLSPMTSGTWTGITLFQARSSVNTINVSGSGALNVTGTVYAASALVDITGSGQVNTFGSSLIADDLDVSGSGSLFA